MTPEEAIQQLEFDRAMILFDSLTGEEITPEMLKLINKENYLTYVADGIAIEALKEVQQYREIGASPEQLKELIFEGSATKRILRHYQEIGTVEECREAVEKQKPKTPVKDKYHHNCCPNCGWIVSGEGGYGEEFCPHCENCGQAIQWGEDLEGMEDE